MPDLTRELAPNRHAAPLPWRRGPVPRLALAGAAGLVPVLAAAAWLAGPAPGPLVLGVAGYAGGVALALSGMRRGYPHPGPGWCNLVTLGRLGVTAALLAPLAAALAAPAAAGASWTLAALAAGALALDGLDGWLARREGHVSEFGARFDMEVDSAFALILAANAWASGAAGPAVLLLGLPRYAFAAAARALPWLDRPLPGRFGRKAVCVVQIATLIALQVPGLPPGLTGPLVAATVAALSWSFGRDILWLWRTRG